MRFKHRDNEGNPIDPDKRDIARLLVGLYCAEIDYSNHLGHERKRVKNYWENKAREFIEKNIEFETGELPEPQF